jgi:uncharacterized protein (TIGR02145 family)
MKTKLIFLIACLSLFSLTWAQKAESNSTETTQSPGSVTDIDGNTYKTVKIGDQIWMAENLRTTRFNSGTPISDTKDTNTGRAFYSSYDNNDQLKDIYGILYSGGIADDYSSSVCPSKWHIPSRNEWRQLIDYLGGKEIAGGKLKEKGIGHWSYPNTGATDDFGFQALPGGYLNTIDDIFNDITIESKFWTATTYNRLIATAVSFRNDQAGVTLMDSIRNSDCLSIRCVMNEDTADYPDLTKGLIAYYPFEDSAKDESGNGHNGTLNGATEIPGDCNTKAYAFDGTENRFAFTGFHLQDPKMTMFSSIKIVDDNVDTFFTSNMSFMNIFMRMENHRYEVGININGRKVILKDRDGIFKIDPLNPRFDVITLVFNGSQVGLKINNQDIDCRLINSLALQMILPTIVDQDIAVHMKGVWDNIRIYNRVLSKTEERYAAFHTFRTVPMVTIDSITNITNESAIVFNTITYGTSGKDIYEFDVFCDTLPSMYGNSIPVSTIWTSKSFNTYLTNLKPSTTYYVWMQSRQNCGSSTYGKPINFITFPEISYDSIYDVEGNAYKILKIGKHRWMIENLRTATYNDGSPLPYIAGNQQWSDQTAGAYCWYDNDTANKRKYGALYNYYTVTDNRNVCPIGWHVPLKEEWDSLPYAFPWPTVKPAGKAVKVEKTFVIFPRDGENYGYTAYPAGFRMGFGEQPAYNGMFLGLNDISFLWKSNGESYNMMSANIIGIDHWIPSSADGMSIRCTEDDEIKNGAPAKGIPANVPIQIATYTEMYPNPASLVLRFTNLQGPCRIIVYDMQGRIQLDKDINGEQVDISELTKGFYLVHINGNNQYLIRKLIKN